MATVRDVANFFIELAVNSDEDSITNLQLNKLLYFAQGHYLARTGKLLFNEDIEAWKYGPVIPSIYAAYKGCGKMPIMTIDDDYDSGVFREDELELLMDVVHEYGKYSPSALVSLTHRAGTPWRDVYVPGANKIISKEALKDYFCKDDRKLRTFDERLNESGIPTVEELPAEWYDPAEDAEWEAYL